MLSLKPLVSTWALKISQRPSVIPREARNLNLPLKSEMSRFRYAPLDMTSCFYCASDYVINFAQLLRTPDSPIAVGVHYRPGLVAGRE